MSTTATYAVSTEEDYNSIPKKVENRRVMSSIVLSEEILEQVPSVRYVEVPVIEEVINRVPKKTIVEIEKIVPRTEIEYVERAVEIPQIHYIDRHVEKEQIQEVVKEVPGELEIREVARTVIKKQPIIHNTTVEKIVEVPGPIIDVTKIPVDFEPVKQYHDIEVPVVVAQTIKPIITQYDEYVDVDVIQYEPEITPVDIYVATPINSKLVTIGAEQDVHNCVSIPPAQYNTILKSLNRNIPDDQMDQIPFIKMNGQITFLSNEEAPGYFPLDSSILTRQMNDKQVDQSNPQVTRYDSIHSRAQEHAGYETEEIYEMDSKYNRQESEAQESTSFLTSRKSIFGFDKKKKLCGC